MGRDRGPIGKVSRNLETNIAETPKIAALMKARPFRSGQHGKNRKKQSEYALQLQEKQRLRLRFGLRENQMRKYYEVANRKKGNTGTILLQLLERRADNLLFRAGFALTRRQARQVCTHGHILINGVACDVPSIQLRPGDVLSIREKSQEFIKNTIEVNSLITDSTPWLTVDKDALAIRVDRLPEREEMDAETRENLIIEYYSR
jgi:small subunit ribosomal protein S4